jgi:predicted acetyltransferase
MVCALIFFLSAKDCRTAPEVYIGRGQIAEALMVAAVVVAYNKGGGGGLKVALQIFVFQRGEEEQALIRGSNPRRTFWRV